MTHADQILAFLGRHPGQWFDDDELAKRLGFTKRQTANAECRILHAKGLIERERIEGKLHNRLATSAGVHKAEAPIRVSSSSRSPGVVAGGGPDLTPAEFEQLAAGVLSGYFGARLGSGYVGSVPKNFDFVSPDGAIVGDAKYYTLVGGTGLPPAKFSIIAEHVWLLEKIGARERFLVFGNERKVPTLWLERYGHLVDAVKFFFLANQGDLERLK